MSDTLADMITRIRNGQKANKVSVKAIFSKLNVNVCNGLKSEGFIDTYEGYKQNCIDRERMYRNWARNNDDPAEASRQKRTADENAKDAKNISREVEKFRRKLNARKKI